MIFVEIIFPINEKGLILLLAAVNGFTIYDLWLHDMHKREKRAAICRWKHMEEEENGCSCTVAVQ